MQTDRFGWTLATVNVAVATIVTTISSLMGFDPSSMLIG